MPEEKIKAAQDKFRLLQELKGKENVTSDGRKINIYANIGSAGDVGYVLENDAGGIGLFRSEFLYLGREDFPTEEEQFQAYRQVVQTMGKRRSSSGRWILARINRRIILTWERKRIPPWDTGPSASA